MNITDELVNDFPNAPYTEQDIRDYMGRHPDIFQWFFQEPGGDHSENLIQSDLSNTFVTILRLTDLIPGTMFRIVFNANGEYNQDNEADYEDIMIGATGNYYADELRPIYGVYLMRGPNNTSDFPISTSGAINYQYRAPTRTEFNSIVGTAASVGEYSQFVGEVEDLVENLQSKRNEVTTICMSRYFKRPVEYLFYGAGEITDFPEEAYTEGYTDGYKALKSEYDGKLYWDWNFYSINNDDDIFTEEEHWQYSPFSIYVLKDSRVGEQDIREHLFHTFVEKGYSNEESLHRVDHMFEKYYIDRYLMAQTPEELLTQYLVVYNRINQGQEVEDLEAWEANPLYVFDPWYKNGKILQVGKEYNYNPAIIYNGEEIDLREIQRYDLDNLEPTETKIQVGNGVYGDIFYHNIETFYTFEDLEGDLKEARDAYNTKLTELRNKKWPNWPDTKDDEETEDPSRQELDDLEDLRIKYCELLETAITEWKSRETDLELE